MNSNNGNLYFDVLLNSTEFNNRLRETENRVHNFSQNTVRETSKLDQAFSRLGVGLASFLSAAAVTNFIQQVISIRGEFEQLEIAFTTMLGSKERADALMRDVARFAATTPFDLKSTAAGTKQLLAYGFAAEDMTQNLSMLGNVASGVGSQIGDLIYLYGTLKASGRVTQMDINQFAGRGIPIYDALAKSLSINVEQVREFVSAGKIGFTDVEKAFQSMTTSGGMFYNLMENQSKSITGQLSNLGDAFDSMLNNFGEQNQEIISGAISSVATLVENYDDVLKILGALIAGYGAYRAALILTTAVESSALVIREVTLINGARLNAMQKLHVIWIAIETKARAALNAVMLANPYALVTASVVTLGVAMWALNDSTTNQEKAFKSLNEEAEAAAKQIENLKAKAGELTTIVRDKSASDLQQNKAFEELQKLYPSLLENMTKEAFIKKDLTEIQKELNVQNDNLSLNELSSRLKQSQVELDLLLKKLENYKNTSKDLGGSGVGLEKNIKNTADLIEIAKIKTKELQSQFEKLKKESEFAQMSDEKKVEHLSNQKKELEQQIIAIKKLNALAGNTQNIFSQISLNNLNNQINLISDKILNLTKKLSTSPRTLGDIDKEIQEKRDDQSGATNSKEYQAIEVQIKKLEAERIKITGVTNKKDISEVKKLAEQRIDILESVTRAQQEAVINGLTSDKREVESARLKYAELRKIVAEYNKNVPKSKQLGPGVIARIDSAEQTVTGQIEYQQYTNAYRTRLEEERKIFEQFEKHKEDFGLKSAISRFSKEIDTAKSFTNILEAERAKLLETDPTKMDAFQLERLQILNDLIDQEIDKEAEKYNSILVELKSYQQQREAIESKYVEIATQLGENLTEEQKKELLQRQNDEIESLNQTAFRKKEIYKTLSEELILHTKESLKAEIAAIEALLENSDLSENLKSELEANLEALNNALDNGVNNNNKAALEQRRKELLEALVDPLIQGTDEAKRYYDELKRLQDELNNLKENKTSKAANKVAERFGTLSTGFSDLSSSLEGVNDELAYTLGTVGELLQVGQDAGKAVAAFATGDFVTGIAKSMQAIAGLFSIGKKVKQMNAEARAEQKKFYDEAIKGELEYQALLRKRAVEEAARGKLTYNQIVAQLELLKKQAPEIESAYNKIFAVLQGQSSVEGVGYEHGTWFRKAKTWDILASLAGSDYDKLEKLYTEGKLKDQAKKDFEALKALKEELIAAGVEVEDLQKQLDELNTGNSIAGITDAFTELFKNLTNSTEDVGRTIEGILKNALLNSFKYRFIEPVAQQLFEQLALDMEDGILSQSEADRFKTMGDEVGKRLKQQWDAISGVLNFTQESNQSGMVGAIKRELTEQGASELVGVQRAMHDISRRRYELALLDSKVFQNTNDVVRQQLFFLSGIKDDTELIAANTNRLSTIEKSLDVIASNTKPAQSTRGLGI